MKSEIIIAVTANIPEPVTGDEGFPLAAAGCAAAVLTILVVVVLYYNLKKNGRKR